ncbi:hypothetical protein Tco_0180892 [Tanacetum coccineum]
MKLYMMNRQHGRMILESVENCPLIWPSIEENKVTRPKKYYELSATKAIQVDCDIKATNIILQGLPPEAVVQNSNSSAQQDALILSMIEQLKTQSIEIDHLKQTLSEHLKEKESLMQTVTLLKNDFKKEESRNIDREIALEKRIKQLDNIKAQQLEPKLYDSNVIKNTSAIVILDSEETLMLAEESRLKMLLKQKDPMMLEKKVNTTPVNYVVLNQLSQDFET